jgi:hypothetical protein
MRDVTVLPLTDKESLVIATDNSGAIGLKELDAVQVPYEMVGYFAFRVAVMECMAAGAAPYAVVMHNFCGDAAWNEITKGVKKGIGELGLFSLPITGSTESNFALVQSALGLMVLGKRPAHVTTDLLYSDNVRLAVIGNPLVGSEVMEHSEQVAPLPLFQWFCGREGVQSILSVGSKGILHEVNQVFLGQTFDLTAIEGEVNLVKSSGPATCFVVAYQGEAEEELRKKAGALFHPIFIRGLDLN